MPHQCTKCSQIYPDAAGELLKGCECGSRFFYYIRQEYVDKITREKIIELDKADKDKIEKDIREITGLSDKPEKPVILDVEAISVIKPGKFEIDIVHLLAPRRPLVYKLEEGKYIIDISSSIKSNKDEIDKKIKDPDLNVLNNGDEKEYQIRQESEEGDS